MSSIKVVITSVTITDDSPFQDYSYITCLIVTPGFQTVSLGTTRMQVKIVKAESIIYALYILMYFL